jgi:hypothetical protein
MSKPIRQAAAIALTIEERRRSATPFAHRLISVCEQIDREAPTDLAVK